MPAIAEQRSDELLQAHSLVNWANLYQDRGDNAGAEPLYRRALPKYERVHRADHNDTANCTNSIGTTCYLQGKLAEAEKFFSSVRCASAR